MQWQITPPREIRVKGIICNLVEEAITAEHGDLTWDALLDSAGPRVPPTT